MSTNVMQQEGTETLRVLIVDDEPVARARLRRLLSDERDVRIVSECEHGAEAVAAILELAPHLVFLDIEMPELTGFEVLETLPANATPSFVFVTAFDQYAIDAFAVNALDYLLKPFDAERFQVTMRRARAQIKAGSSQREVLTALRELSQVQKEIRAAVAPPDDEQGHVLRHAYLDRLAVKTNGNIIFVRVADIDFIESAANYVRIHVGATTHMMREKLGELATRLDPAHFARIHRTTIVNRDRIKEIQPWFSGDALVILQTGAKLRLSRVYRASLDLGSRPRR